MVKWRQEAVKTLLEIAKSKPDLVKLIRLSVQNIEESPDIGQFGMSNLRIYTHTTHRFRIGYSVSQDPEANWITIIEIGLF